jgi:hypothetical protein
MTTIPTVAEAQRFTFTLKSLGGTPPAVLTQLLDLIETVKNAPAASDPVSGLVDAAVNGRAGTAAELAKLVEKAAKAESEAEYWRRLQTQIERDAMRRFAVELGGGAADLCVDSLRPAFTDFAEQIAAATAVVDYTWSTERLVADGDLEQLSAYRVLPDLVAKLDRIVALVSSLGPNGTFAVLDEPDHSVQLRGLRAEALWATADLDPWRASEIIRARVSDWKSSPWLRLPLTLNSVAVAAERLRSFAEAEWAAIENSRGVRGTMTANGHVVDPPRINPFAAPSTSVEPELEPAEV